MRKSILTLGAVLLLTGCSGEPGEGNMEDALTRLMQQQIDDARSMARMFGGEKAVEGVPDFKGFDAFEKLGCTEVADKKAWRCDFKMSVTIADKHQEQQSFGLFSKGDKGWVATDVK